MLWPILLFQCYMAIIAALAVPPKDHDSRQYFVVEIDHSRLAHNLNTFISEHSEYQFEHPVRGIDDHFVFSIDKNHDYLHFLGNHNSDTHQLMKRAPGYEDPHDALINHPGLKLVQMLYPTRLERRRPVPMNIEKGPSLGHPDDSLDVFKELSEKLDINDPLFLRQWHLVNTRYPGNDINVKNVWYSGIRGHNVTVAVVDDGLDYDLEDLKANFNAKGSWDFNDNTDLPTPRLFDDFHGTRCAGEIAAVKNDQCGIGVAYEAKVSGIRILSGHVTLEEEAAALIYGLDENDIYSNSWGPSDNGQTVAGPSMLVRKAFIKGVQDGRQNKGAVYVFASGNGADNYDQCNFDGYTNSIYTFTVGAIDHKNLIPNYAEACSAVMVVTYSSGSGESIHTTDPKEKCCHTHGGTSAAAPMAAGVIALMLEANPELSWRDVQHIAARAGVTINEDDGEYQETALGLKYSHKYGYGKMDTEKLVDMAKDWRVVKPQAWYYSDLVEVNETVSSKATAASEWISSSANITGDDLQLVNFESVEHVTVKVNIESTFRGQIQVRLISPEGVVSKLAERRPFDRVGTGLQDWTFMSVAHFGESGVGVWQLEVSSSRGENEVTLKNWQLRFFGEAIDADQAEKYDISKDYAAERRDLSKEVLKQTTSTEAILTTKALLTTSTTSKATDKTSLTSTDAATTSKSTGLESEKSKNPQETAHHGNPHSALEVDAQVLLAIAVLIFIVAIVVMRRHNTLRVNRRRRAEAIEFDLVPGDDYRDTSEEELESLSRHLDRDDTRLLNEHLTFQVGDFEESDLENGVPPDEQGIRG